MTDDFPEIIGQEATKRKLSFYLNNFKNSGLWLPTILVAPKGTGKTYLVTKSLRHKLIRHGEHRAKKCVVINCSNLKPSLKHFFEVVVTPHLADRDITIFFDEASEIPKPITMALLSILNPNEGHRNEYTYDNNNIMFDCHRITWLFATSEPHRVFHALMDRLQRIDLETYEPCQFAAMVSKELEGITIKDNVMEDVVPILRGNARAAQKCGHDIFEYLKTKTKKTFDKTDWVEIRASLGIRPLGLNETELNVLKVLSNHRDGVTLTALAAKTGYTRKALQGEVENFLHQNNLITINQDGRNITKKGLEILAQAGYKIA